MKLLIASNNAHKVKEIKEILRGYFEDIVTLKEAGLSIEVEEDGKTFEENAIKKAKETMEKSGFEAVLADDSGLCVEALNGAPGVYSARYAGLQHNDEDNNRKLMEDMAEVPEERRGCAFVCCMALARKGKATLCCRGTVEGRLLYGPKGENGFGYDPYFFYPPFDCSFAELSAEQKNKVSHRKNALENLRQVLDSESDHGVLEELLPLFN